MEGGRLTGKERGVLCYCERKGCRRVCVSDVWLENREQEKVES